MSQSYTEQQIEKVTEFRSQLKAEISAQMSDSDCHRFLKARKYAIPAAIEMSEKWWVWRNTELAPTTLPGVTPANILEKMRDDNLMNHPQRHLLPFALHGEDKEGRPMYYERTGRISAHFHDVKKLWTLDELLAFHVHSMEISELRLKYSSFKHGKDITQWVCVNDMARLNLAPDFDCISYARRQLAMDQNFYPERLFKLYIINAPWFFSTLFALVSPFLDAATVQKINITSNNSHIDQMTNVVDMSEIPVEMSGSMENVPWCGPFLDHYGCSQHQIHYYLDNHTIDTSGSSSSSSSNSNSGGDSTADSTVNSTADGVDTQKKKNSSENTGESTAADTPN